MTPELEAFLARCRDQVNEHLSALLDGRDNLERAMAYAVSGGGKRVRPALCYAAADLYGQAGESVHRAAMAVELIHAYSLVHDDLPAMDDDDLRRGQPTCHIAFDEATAILAGDALQTLAFEVLAEPGRIDSGIQIRLVRELATAAGHRGMAGGQADDLGAVGRSLPIAELERIHRRKTGALIRASIVMGALAAGRAPESDLTALGQFAQAAGLAFQVQDDILDEQASTETLGKRQGADRARGKPTYISSLGLDGARRKLTELHTEARDTLATLPEAGGRLAELADYLATRDH